MSPDRQSERETMVNEQIRTRGIRDPRVLDALLNIPRHLFLPPDLRDTRYAYTDTPQAIGEGQTISQPYIVALMSERLRLTGTEKVLEIGAGSGYQTAILSRLCREIIAIERHAPLAQRAAATLARLNIANVQLLLGDGSLGWSPESPYDAILVAAAAPTIPPALVQQLAPGGRLILPVGEQDRIQHLLLLEKHPDHTLTTTDLGEVGFVPLVGSQGFGLPDDLGDMDF